MNIYRIYRTDRIYYDEYDAIIVYAKDKAEGLSIGPEESTWTDKSNLEVEYLGSNTLVKNKGYILGSYNAG